MNSRRSKMTFLGARLRPSDLARSVSRESFRCSSREFASSHGDDATPSTKSTARVAGPWTRTVRDRQAGPMRLERMTQTL